MYADNTALIAQNSDINIAIQTLEESVDTISQWLKTWCVGVNITKCETNIVSLQRANNNNPAKIIVIDQK